MSALPTPHPARKRGPMMDLSVATLGWLNRATQAVGSIRFDEALGRAAFYLARTAAHAHTPAENAIVDGLESTLDALAVLDREARALLAESCLAMNAVEATEFVEMCEDAEHPVDPAI